MAEEKEQIFFISLFSFFTSEINNNEESRSPAIDKIKDPLRYASGKAELFKLRCAIIRMNRSVPARKPAFFLKSATRFEG